MTDLPTPWNLTNFEHRLDEWIALEHPDGELRVVVTTWILSRFDDPYEGARREPGFDNLWFAVVPGSIHAPGQVVVCSYFIEEARHEVRCDRIASLSYPAT